MIVVDAEVCVFLDFDEVQTNMYEVFVSSVRSLFGCFLSFLFSNEGTTHEWAVKYLSISRRAPSSWNGQEKWKGNQIDSLSSFAYTSVLHQLSEFGQKSTALSLSRFSGQIMAFEFVTSD